MANHKLVFKNTLFLYVRVFISMAIGLYTSRVILRELGVDNFGIYSVVGSLSMMFGYLNYGISSSLQRFMSCEIALNNINGLRKCFASSLQAAIYLSLLLFLLCETVGIWALTDIIDIPPGRESDAMFVFQVSIVILVIELFKTCCLSLIIAQERMSFFAYVSIAESFLKLIIVFMLALFPGNSLRAYILLLAAVSMMVLGSYIVYCRMKFPAVRFSLRGGRERLREIFSFTGWNTLASFADLCYMQGSNIILNVFYGVAYNATMGITTQIKNALFSFSKNLQTAANPHLTKEFAKGEYGSFSKLAVTISVLSCLLLYLFGLPIILNIDLILDIWLTTVPPAGAIFIRLMIIFCLVDSLVGPLWVAMQAYGKIRNYQIIISTGWMLSLPAMWLVLKMGGAPESILLVQIAINSLLLAIRLWFATRYCHIRLGDYLSNVLLRLAATIVMAGALPLFLYFSIPGEIVRFFATTAATLVTVPLCTIFIAINRNDRSTLLSLVKKRLSQR